MDWTSVFVEDGTEDLIIPSQFLVEEQQKNSSRTAPRLARLVSKVYYHHHHNHNHHHHHQSEHENQEHDYRIRQYTDDRNNDWSYNIISNRTLLLGATTGTDDGQQQQFHHQQQRQHSNKRLFDKTTSISDETEATQEEEVEVEEHVYNLKVLYYLSINYILGVGCLGIPYAFARAGYILCMSILIIVTLSSYMTVVWVAETGERYEIIKQQQQQRHDDNNRNFSNNSNNNNNNNARTSEYCINDENTSLIGSRNQQRRHRSSSLSDEGHDEINYRDIDRYEVIDLVDHYLGHSHKVLYQVSLMSLMYIGLLAYSQVFCGSIGALLWQPKGPFDRDHWTGLPQLIFGALVVPLSCMELDEQVTIQSIMAYVRFAAIFVMVFGSAFALLYDGTHSNFDHAPYWASEESGTMSYTACFSGFGVAFSTSLFSQLFQHSVPGLLRPIRREQPEKLTKVPWVLGASLLTTLSFYILLGTITPSYFGADTRPSINLNFAHFTFGVNPTEASPALLACLTSASNIVVMFPALDTISVFPLIANTLGNNLYASAGSGTVKLVAKRLVQWGMHGYKNEAETDSVSRNAGYSLMSTDERKAILLSASKVSTIIWRIVAALPPLLGSLVATDLSFSFLLAGVAGLYVAFFAPSLLHLESSRLVAESTIYEGWYSPTFLCYPVLVFATLSLGIVLVQIVDALLGT